MNKRMVGLLAMTAMLGGMGSQPPARAATPTLPARGQTPPCFKCKGDSQVIDLRTRLKPDVTEQTRKDVETAYGLGAVAYQCTSCKAVWMVVPQQITGTAPPPALPVPPPPQPARNRKERRRNQKLRGKRQTEIPGTKRAMHKDVAKKAAELFEVRQQRMELSEEEGRLAGELIALMKKHGIDEYTEDGMTVTVVTPEEKVKVRKRADPDEDE